MISKPENNLQTQELIQAVGQSIENLASRLQGGVAILDVGKDINSIHKTDTEICHLRILTRSIRKFGLDAELLCDYFEKDRNHFTIDADHELTCSCGNDTFQEGFQTCLADGTEVEPLRDGPWKGWLKCGKCGVVELQPNYSEEGEEGEEGGRK